MNDKTLRALDRALDRLDQATSRERRRGRFSTAPIVLALGLVLGYQLLARFVPMVWAALLPGGLEQIRLLRGWPGLVASLALLCHRRFSWAAGTISLIAGAGFLISAWVRPLRILVWLAALATILLDAGIVYVVLRTSLDATLQGVGLG